MRLFVTRVWGFDPKTWPVITFGLKGNRDNLLTNSSPGDQIAFVGTLREPTVITERGRLLGVAEIGRVPVNTMDFVDESVRGPQDFDDNGLFRWPKAILMIRAWRFVPQPLLLDLVDEQLPYHATAQAILFSDEDASRIRALNLEEMHLPDSDALSRARTLDEALGRNGPTTGPTPSSWSGSTGKDANQKAYTYAMQFGDSDVWKIGYSTDVPKRAQVLNQHIPSEIISQYWRPIMTQQWPTEKAAYDMEQLLLKELTEFRTTGERVQCREAEIWKAWKKGIGL